MANHTAKQKSALTRRSLDVVPSKRNYIGNLLRRRLPKCVDVGD